MNKNYGYNFNLRRSSISESGEEYEEGESDINPKTDPEKDFQEREFNHDEDYEWEDEYNPDEEYDWGDEYNPDEEYDWGDEYNPDEEYDWGDEYNPDEEYDWGDDNFEPVNDPPDNENDYESNLSREGTETILVPLEKESENEPLEEPDQESDPEVVLEWAPPEELAGEEIQEIEIPEDTFESIETLEEEPVNTPELEPDPEIVPEWIPPEELTGGEISGIDVPEDAFEPLKEPEQEQDPEIVPEWALPEELAAGDIPEIELPEGTFEPLEEPEEEAINSPEQESREEKNYENPQESPDETYSEMIQERNRTLVMADNFSSSYRDTQSLKNIIPTEKRRERIKTEKKLQKKIKKSYNQKKDSGPDYKIINKQRSGQSTVLVLKSELESQEKEKETKKETEKKQIKKENETKEIKATKNVEQQGNSKIEKEDEQELPKEQKSKPLQETGKKATYIQKKNKKIDERLEKKNESKQEQQTDRKSEEKNEKREDWEILLEKWIIEADETEIPDNIKKELIEKIKKYRHLQNLSRKLIVLLQKHNPTETQIAQIKNLMKKIKDLDLLKEEIFENLRAFKKFYNKNIIWFESKIDAQRKDFTKHLARKLQQIKNQSNSNKTIIDPERNWKNALRKAIDSIEQIDDSEKQIIIKILNKSEISEAEINKLALILSKLETDQLIGIFGENFRLHTKNYVRWSFDFYRNIKIDILKQYFIKKNNIIHDTSDLFKILRKHFPKKVEKRDDKDRLTNDNTHEVHRSLSIERDLGIIAQDYSTIKLFNDLFKEVTKLVPLSWLAKKGKHVGQINEERLNKVLGFGKAFIRSKTNLIEKGVYPDYQLSLLQINDAIKNLNKLYGKDAKTCIELFHQYKSANNLKESPKQQWHIHNPDLEVNYFDIIDKVEKAFWFGVLCADGYVKYNEISKIYIIDLEVALKDRKLIDNFCKAIKISGTRIFTRERLMKNGKIVPMIGVRFHCKPMVDSLRKHGISGIKSSRGNIPSFHKSRQLYLAWLRGYYEGDGKAQGTSIVAINRRLLVQIKKSLKIKYDIGINTKHYTYFDIEGKFHIRKTTYVLAFGPTLFNEMTSICKNSGVPLLKRKDHMASDVFERYDKFKEQLRIMKVDRIKLRKMLFKFKKYELQEIFKISKHLLNKTIEEWQIETPPRGYWKTSKENRDQIQKQLGLI